MCAFIEEHREEHGVEPICRTLQIAPSTYYAYRTRPASDRSIRDSELTQDIKAVHEENYGVYDLTRATLAVFGDLGPWIVGFPGFLLCFLRTN